MTDQKERTGKTYSKGEANGIENYGDTRIYNKKYPKSILEVSNANQSGKTHPTQKPQRAKLGGIVRKLIKRHLITQVYKYIIK